MSSPRWAEGLAFYKDLSIKVRPASVPLLTLMSFSRAHKSLGCQIKWFFFEKVKESVDLVLNLFPTQMISDILLS